MYQEEHHEFTSILNDQSRAPEGPQIDFGSACVSHHNISKNEQTSSQQRYLPLFSESDHRVEDVEFKHVVLEKSKKHFKNADIR